MAKEIKTNVEMPIQGFSQPILEQLAKNEKDTMAKNVQDTN